MSTIERLLYDQIDMLRARNKELEAALKDARTRGTHIRVEFPQNDVALIKMAADDLGVTLEMFIIEATRMRIERVLAVK